MDRAPPQGLVLPETLTLVGGGKMGTAMLRAWLSIGLEAERISILEPSPSFELSELIALHRCHLGAPSAPPNVLVLAVKPQSLDGAAEALQQFAGDKTLLLSILAGKTIANLEQRFPKTRNIVRAMPNLPAAICRGMTGLTAKPSLEAKQKAVSETLMSALGEIAWVSNENLMDSLTAVSGSGPAYVFYLTETLAAAGVSAGLEEALAMRLARTAIIGAAELLSQNCGLSAANLRESVTSKGGVTAAALEVLMDPHGLRELMEKAVLAARDRGMELSG